MELDSMPVKRRIGKNWLEFTVHGNNAEELAESANKYSFGDLFKCGICGHDDLYLNFRIAGVKKFKYTEIKCRKCKAALVMGKTKENPNVMFYRRDPETKEYAWKEYSVEHEDQEKIGE